MRILVVEDDQPTAKTLQRALEEHCHAVDLEANGETGFYRARTNDYDLIILDNGLPGKEGSEICRGIREYKISVPILMLSAWTEIDQKVALLQCGADDYVTKPYSLSELLARIEALARRSRGAAINEPLSVDGLVLNKETYTVTRDGNSVYLTPKEFSLLEYFMMNRGRVLSRGRILEHVWDGRVDGFTNAIESHVKNLRKKIEADSGRKFIHTVSGRGYRFE